MRKGKGRARKGWGGSEKGRIGREKGRQGHKKGRQGHEKGKKGRQRLEKQLGPTREQGSYAEQGIQPQMAEGQPGLTDTEVCCAMATGGRVV